MGLSACALVIPIFPALWILVTAPWQVIFINIPAGIFWTGLNLAAFNLLLELTPTEARADSAALYQFMVAGAMVLGPLLGGYLADAYGFNATFAVSAIGRLLGALAFLWWVARPVARQRRATLPTQTQQRNTRQRGQQPDLYGRHLSRIWPLQPQQPAQPRDALLAAPLVRAGEDVVAHVLAGAQQIVGSAGDGQLLRHIGHPACPIERVHVARLDEERPRARSTPRCRPCRPGSTAPGHNCTSNSRSTAAASLCSRTNSR